MSTRIYADYELRGMLARYVRGSALNADVAAVLVPTVQIVLDQRDEARARCVELLGPQKRREPPRLLPEELLTAIQELQGAAAEVCTPVENRLIDAMLALVAYVQRLPLPAPVEPDRESILTDPKAIAERHGVNVSLLCDRLDALDSNEGIDLSYPESLFLMDLLASVGLE